MTPPSSSTGSSSIDARRSGGGGGSGRSEPLRLASLLPLLLPVGVAACSAQEPPAADPAEEAVPVELIRHGAGGASPVDLDATCRERIPELAAELLAEAAPVRLLVDEERIREVRAGGALEVVFDEPRPFATAARVDTNARRLLLPLEDPYWVGTEERPFVVVFLGDETYGSGPYRNEEGLRLLRELEACASGA